MAKDKKKDKKDKKDKKKEKKLLKEEQKLLKASVESPSVPGEAAPARRRPAQDQTQRV